MLEFICAWCEVLTLSSEAMEAQLLLVLKSIEENNSQPIWHNLSAVRVAYTDAITPLLLEWRILMPVVLDI